MAISESQLDIWSHQGSIQQSSSTYNSIKSTLEAAGTPYSGKGYKVFLQGSYGNDTNIYAESDVDVVIRLDDCFYSDLSELSEAEKSAQEKAYSDAAYSYSDFKRDVLATLIAQYGSDVKEGGKAIAIGASGNRRKTDVIVAAQFRRYFKFNSNSDQSYAEGICFWNSAGERIANYPKQHSANLTANHQASNQWLKPMVRILKNMRSRCVDEGLLKAGTAPSYFIEGLLYNVPTDLLSKNYQNCFMNAFNWIQNEADKDKLVCANEQYYLLRDASHTCWPKPDGEAFINATISLWNDW
ncbi:nucleotidyltransferase [Thiobacillus denitrificans]|uniref:nucleotidyltransferase domain-containing protein n=1 Tax=Thiobacillus denitrificans TaxID=36861 RepID=UPI00037062A1|nr:nucleotidyltransferase [Thiobacillus denitrificans]